jgi:peptidoglycan/LPS O-acetylase OafA/YrhL
LKEYVRTKDGYFAGIDGLRAIAVISVLIYHLDFSTLAGGFTGVDMFFVISGFVVSYSLSQHNNEPFGRFILKFYSRRVLRILPALFFCLAVTSILANYFIPNSWLSQTITDTGLTAIIGLSNFTLAFSDGGYFSPLSEFNPFTHTWSLGVEEQFYFLFPVMFFVWMRSKASSNYAGFLLRHSIAVAATLSFLFCVYASYYSKNVAYYLIFSRFWQLALGAILFQIIFKIDFEEKFDSYGKIPLVLGIVFIIASLIFSNKSSFPFPWGVLPVAGTLLLITHLVQTKEMDFFVFFCNLKLVRIVGKLSYSLYLWHWPIYTLMRWTVGMDNYIHYCLALLLTTIASICSYYIIENSFRNISVLKKMPKMTIVISCIGAILTYSVFYQAERANILKQSITSSDFDWFPSSINHGVNLDVISNHNKQFADRTIFVIGDSHVQAYNAMITGAGMLLGANVRLLGKGGCPMLGFTNIKPNTGCREFVDSQIQLVIQDSKPGDIVFLPSLRLTRLTEQYSKLSMDKVLEKHSILTSDNSISDFYTRANEELTKLEGIGLSLIIEAPKPLLRSPPFRCSDWFNKNNSVCEDGLQVNRKFLEDYRAPIFDTLKKLESFSPDRILWDPFYTLCPGEKCTAFLNDKPLYFDGDHLSGYANRLLLPSFVGTIEEIWGAENK